MSRLFLVQGYNPLSRSAPLAALPFPELEQGCSNRAPFYISSSPCRELPLFPFAETSTRFLMFFARSPYLYPFPHTRGRVFLRARGMRVFFFFRKFFSAPDVPYLCPSCCIPSLYLRPTLPPSQPISLIVLEEAFTCTDTSISVPSRLCLACMVLASTQIIMKPWFCFGFKTRTGALNNFFTLFSDYAAPPSPLLFS